MARPSVLPEWATTGSAQIMEPTLAQKQAGWSSATRPPAQWFNWWMRLVYQWIAAIADEVSGRAKARVTWDHGTPVLDTAASKFVDSISVSSEGNIGINLTDGYANQSWVAMAGPKYYTNGIFNSFLVCRRIANFGRDYPYVTVMTTAGVGVDFTATAGVLEVFFF